MGSFRETEVSLSGKCCPACLVGAAKAVEGLAVALYNYLYVHARCLFNATSDP